MLSWATGRFSVLPGLLKPGELKPTLKLKIQKSSVGFFLQPKYNGTHSRSNRATSKLRSPNQI